MQTKVPFIKFFMVTLLSWIKHLAGFLSLVCAYQKKEWEKEEKKKEKKKKLGLHVFLLLLDAGFVCLLNLFEGLG